MIDNNDHNMKNTSDRWRGLPENLKSLLRITATELDFSSENVLKWLISHYHDCDSARYGISAHSILTWIDRTFESVLFPVELSDENWTLLISSIEDILLRYEEILIKNAPPDYKQISRRDNDDYYEENYVERYQHLCVYQSFADMYTESYWKLDRHLNNVLDATFRNMEYLFTLEEKEIGEILDEDDFDDEWHYEGCDQWQPILWIAKEVIPTQKAEMAVADALEKYAQFLAEHAKDGTTQVLNRIRQKAEDRLKTLCCSIIDDLTDKKRFSNGKDDVYLDSVTEYYQKMISASEERESGMKKPGETSCDQKGVF